MTDLYDDVPETDTSITWVQRSVNTRTIRSDHAYKTMREQYRIECMVRRQPDGSKGDPCCRCTERIDYSLQYPHPFSWSLEHIIKVADRPELLLDRNNWSSAHFGCNSMNGPDDHVADTGEPSEDW